MSWDRHNNHNNNDVDFDKDIEIDIDFDQDFDTDIRVDKDVDIDVYIDSDVDIHGNSASLGFDVQAVGEHTLAELDFVVLVLENELSSVSGFAVAAVD